ncbi:MAG: transposase family protein [Ignavibacteria bacterium]|nr:transposase family protein [Ignavibacteria bacterium]
MDEAIEKKYNGSTLEKKAKDAGITIKYRRLNDKLKAYRKYGLNAIVRIQRYDKDETRKISPEVLQLLTTTFTKFQNALRTYEQVHKLLRSRSVEFRTFKFENGQKIVDVIYNISDGVLYRQEESVTVYSTVFSAGEYITNDGESLLIAGYDSCAGHLQNFRNNNKDVLHVQRFGVESYRLKMQHSIRRDYSMLAPNDLWSADNKKLDLLVIGWDWRAVFRPWLSGFLRVPTREYSYEISHSPNSESIANSFVLAAKKWGLPKEINHDLGKDYLSDRLAKMFQSLGIKQAKSISRNARAKAIESFHNILDNKLKCLPGYTGNKYQEMPEETRLMLKKFTKAEKVFKNIDKHVFDPDFKLTLNGNLEGKIKSSKQRFLHISELIPVINEALREYEETVHGGLEKDKLGRKVNDRLCADEAVNKLGVKLNTPAGRLMYHYAQEWEPVYAHEEVLAIFAMNSAVRVVRPAGIDIHNNTYFSPKLMKHINKKVLVKYTSASDKFIYVFTSDEIANLKNDAEFREANGFDIINRAEFVSLCEKIKVYDYGDLSYKEQLTEQRREEKQLKYVSGKTQITGFEANITPIQKEVEAIYEKNKPLSKLKDIFDE